MIEKRNIIYDLGRPVKAHDIRKLEPCAICGGIGYGPQMLMLPVAGEKKPQPHHGACIVASMTHEEIMNLPADQSIKLRLNETGPDLMRKLLGRSSPLEDVQ